MKHTAEVVIIGGGIMGASIAYHLAARGCTDVLLLERAEDFGLGSTGQNAGGIRHQFANEVNIELSRLSIAMMERFAAEMEQSLDLNFCGYLFLLDNELDWSRFRQQVEVQRRCGIDTQLLTPDEVAERVPLLRLDDILGATFYERDGLTDPHGLLQGYLTQARRRGAQLETGITVSEIAIEAGKVRGVSTSEGPVAAPHVVIATGAWSGEFGERMGIHLPVQPIRRQLAVTRPLPGITRDFPFVIDFSEALYFHYESGGLLTGKSNRDEPPGFDISVDEEWRLVHFETALRRLPVLESAEILTEWAGLYEVTPDDQPILGQLPQAEGLYACTGFSGHGLMHGPIAGLLLAEEIVDGAAHTVDITPLRYRRFESGAIVAEYNVV